MKIKDQITKDNWTKGYMARNSFGLPVSMISEGAIQFCLLAWIWKCYPVEESGDVIKKIKEKVEYSVGYFNDRPETTFEDVHSLCEWLDI